MVENMGHGAQSKEKRTKRRGQRAKSWRGNDS